jgi:RNA polymerase sigma-70 factor (ECF subfamily)
MREDTEERTAIERLRAGDLGGLEWVVRTYQLEALRAAYLIVRDRALAEDIVQEAFVTLPKRLKTFDNHLPFRPWFLRLVANEALKALHRRGREVPLQDQAWRSIALADPAEAVIEEELKADVWAALGQLDPQLRSLVVLRYFAGLSEADLAAQLGRPEGTVRWWLYKARKLLRELLGAKGGELYEH